MAEGGTTAFERWVEPHLTALAVTPAGGSHPTSATRSCDRSWSAPTSAGRRTTRRRARRTAWLLQIDGRQGRRRDRTGRAPGRGRARRRPRRMRTGPATSTWSGPWRARPAGTACRRPPSSSGLDVATVAEVSALPRRDHTGPRTGAAVRLVGDDGPDLMDQRLSAAARRWQDEQPPAPEVPLERLDQSLRRRVPWRRTLAVAGVALLVTGAAAVLSGLGRRPWQAAGRMRPRHPRRGSSAR